VPQSGYFTIVSKYNTAWQNLLCGNTVSYFVLGQH